MAANPAFSALFDRDGATLVDLTHPMRPGMPVWPTHPPFCQEVAESYERGDVALNHALCLSEHSGTHFDAPLHFIRGGRSIDRMPPERFFGRMAVIDARDAAPCEAIGTERIAAFEAGHGPIEAGDAVFFHFGWDRFWDDPAPQDRFLRDWPGLSGAAAALLVQRGARIVGSDCLSIDRFGSTDFPAHNRLLGADILIGENFANLGRLPAFADLVTLPLPIVGGSGAPLRAFAILRPASNPHPRTQA
ncbi:cyclase [Aureimonas endophytica]|uniref:Cyclase n=1 Tax=Aureimonas endophytica TaxID=2027858 RepID=A0A916ZN79_9HYPH|nr:cyclase family protein [Aureimonas endophytica]GGE05779.1 cyclase [Aureimonas endophytica]